MEKVLVSALAWAQALAELTKTRGFAYLKQVMVILLLYSTVANTTQAPGWLCPSFAFSSWKASCEFLGFPELPIRDEAHHYNQK